MPLGLFRVGHFLVLAGLVQISEGRLMAEKITVDKEDYDMLRACCELLMTIICHQPILEMYSEVFPDLVKDEGFDMEGD
jgi:hypothetical protein